MTDDRLTDPMLDELARVRMYLSAGLSVFEDLDLVTGHERAKAMFSAIEHALNRFDQLRDEAGLLCTRDRMAQRSGNRPTLN